MSPTSSNSEELGTKGFVAEKPEQHIFIDEPELESALKEAYAIVERKGEDGELYIRAAKGDPSHPREWSALKRCKYSLVTVVASSATLGGAKRSHGRADS